MTDPADIWRQRRLDAEALIEQAMAVEEEVGVAEDLPTKTALLVQANNLRLQALCLLDPMTRPVEPEEDSSLKVQDDSSEEE